MMEVLIRGSGFRVNVLDRKGLKGSRKKKKETRIKSKDEGWGVEAG